MKSDSAIWDNYPAIREVAPPRRATKLPPLPPPAAPLGCAPDLLAAWARLAIAIVGCGSVGGRIALLLARMGLGWLLLVDPKNYKPASRATHEIGPEDVGQPKALVVGRRCKAVSPASRIQTFVGRVEDLELETLADMDLIVMAPDLLAVEIDLARRCLALGTPLCQASVHGATLTAQVRLFANASTHGPCPACLYGQTEWDQLSRQARYSCEGALRPGAPATAEPPATNSLSALCSLGADLAVLQALRFLFRVGRPVGDTLLEYNGFTHRTVISPLAFNPQCRLGHAPRLERAAVEVPLGRLSLAEIARRATGADLAPEAQFELAGLDWVEFGACRCSQRIPVRRFVRRGRPKLATGEIEVMQNGRSGTGSSSAEFSWADSL